MRTLLLDTRAEAEKVLISLLRNANTAKKFAQIRSLSQTTIQLSRQAIARANRDLSEEQINLQFITLHYGEELAYNVKKFLDRKSQMKIPDILLAVQPVIQAFDKMLIPYYIGGSIASSVYGMARYYRRH